VCVCEFCYCLNYIMLEAEVKKIKSSIVDYVGFGEFVNGSR
jgi:Zn-finger protein